MGGKYRLLTVEVKSALFSDKKGGRCYVKVSTHKENQLKTSKINIRTEEWKQKFVFVVPSNESSSLRFEIFKAGTIFLSPDYLVGVAEYKLDTEEEETVYDTYREYDTDTDTDGYLSCSHFMEWPQKTDTGLDELCAPDHELKVSTSLKIWKRKIIKGKLDVEIVMEKNTSIVGGFNWKCFGMKYKDFMMEDINGSPGGWAALMCSYA